MAAVRAESMLALSSLEVLPEELPEVKAPGCDPAEPAATNVRGWRRLSTITPLMPRPSTTRTRTR